MWLQAVPGRMVMLSRLTVSLTFPVGQTELHPKTKPAPLFQDDQHGIAGSDHRLFFKDLSGLWITLRVFRP